MELAEKQFPSTTTVKWSYEERDIGLCFCWETFGSSHGNCDYSALSPYCFCPLALKERVENVKPHCHMGTWTSVWLGKTGYDFGYKEFFFKNKSDREVFEQRIPAINYSRIINENLARDQWFKI